MIKQRIIKKIEDMKKKLKNEIQNSKEIYIKNGGGLLWMKLKEF